MTQACWKSRYFRVAAVCSLITLFVIFSQMVNNSTSMRSSLNLFLHPPHLTGVMHLPNHASNLVSNVYTITDPLEYFLVARFFPMMALLSPIFWPFLRNYGFISYILSAFSWLLIVFSKAMRLSWNNPASTEGLLGLRNEIISSWLGVAFLANCGLIILLSTYHKTSIMDIPTSLECHFKYGHTQGDNDNNEHREKEYWDHLNSSLQARNILESFWALRIGICCCMLLLNGPHGALACLFHHMQDLALAAIPLKETADEHYATVLWLDIFSSSYLAVLSGGSYTGPWLVDCLYSICVYTFNSQLSVVWMNELPCILCDEVKPDIKLVKVARATNTLGRFKEEMCRHCWGPWSGGDDVAVLRCGHVYHQHCCDECFRTSGRRQCPMCQFEVSAHDYQRAFRKRKVWTQAEIQERHDVIYPWPAPRPQ